MSGRFLVSVLGDSKPWCLSFIPLAPKVLADTEAVREVIAGAVRTRVPMPGGLGLNQPKSNDPSGFDIVGPRQRRTVRAGVKSAASSHDQPTTTTNSVRIGLS